MSEFLYYFLLRLFWVMIIVGGIGMYFAQPKKSNLSTSDGETI